jgi:hypothetical protein
LEKSELRAAKESRQKLNLERELRKIKQPPLMENNKNFNQSKDTLSNILNADSNDNILDGSIECIDFEKHDDVSILSLNSEVFNQRNNRNNRNTIKQITKNKMLNFIETQKTAPLLKKRSNKMSLSLFADSFEANSKAVILPFKNSNEKKNRLSLSFSDIGHQNDFGDDSFGDRFKFS